MKKIYETPVCQTVYTAEDDVLTSSQFAIANKIDDAGGFGDGAIIKW